MYEINLKHEVLSTIDELNQYLLGNVTNESVVQSLSDLQSNIIRYKFN